MCINYYGTESTDRTVIMRIIFLILICIALHVDSSYLASGNKTSVHDIETIVNSANDGNEKQCVDLHGRVIEDGGEFTSLDDPCRTCHCQKGYIMCVSVQCSPPMCNYKQIPDECCKFICLDDNGAATPADGKDNDMGMRMVATRMTSLLIILLLVLVIHRLHRKNVLIAHRRMNAALERVEDNGVHMINRDDIHHPLNYSFEEPPPPYTPHKSSWGTMEEPPPYEASARGGSSPGSEGVGSDTASREERRSRVGQGDSTCEGRRSNAEISIECGSEYGVFYTDGSDVADTLRHASRSSAGGNNCDTHGEANALCGNRSKTSVCSNIDSAHLLQPLHENLSMQNNNNDEINRDDSISLSDIENIGVSVDNSGNLSQNQNQLYDHDLLLNNQMNR